MICPVSCLRSTFRNCQLVRNAVRWASSGSSSSTGGSSVSVRREKVYLNEVRLLGRVGAEPQLRGTEPSMIATFPLATGLFWKTDGEPKERTDWHRIVVGIPPLRDHVIKSVTRGDRLLVLGSIQYREWKDKDGIKRNSAFIAATRLLNLTSKLLQNAGDASSLDAEEEEAVDQYIEPPAQDGKIGSH